MTNAHAHIDELEQRQLAAFRALGLSEEAAVKGRGTLSEPATRTPAGESEETYGQWSARMHRKLDGQDRLIATIREEREARENRRATPRRTVVRETGTAPGTEGQRPEDQQRAAAYRALGLSGIALETAVKGRR